MDSDEDDLAWYDIQRFLPEASADAAEPWAALLAAWETGPTPPRQLASAAQAACGPKTTAEFARACASALAAIAGQLARKGRRAEAEQYHEAATTLEGRLLGNLTPEMLVHAANLSLGRQR